MYTADMKIEDVIKGQILTHNGNHKERKNFIHEETLQKMMDDLYEIQSNLAEKEYKMEQLVSKLCVDFEGDSLQGSYKLRFSHFPGEQNDVQRAILKAVVEMYGLELQREREKIAGFISFVDAISAKNDYCEVDLFSKDKKPVEC